MKYVEDLYNKRPINSNVDIFKEAMKILEEYDEIYFMRSKARGDALGEYDSEFEKSVHHYLMREISPLFDHDITVIEAIGKREVVVQDEDGNDMIRRLHFQFHYDCYLKLDRELRNYFGLDDRWKGIAVEVLGIYWHGQDFPVHIERDKFKKAVSMQENIIQIDIWEDVEQDQWINEFITQLNEQAGTSITKNDLSKIKNYLV